MTTPSSPQALRFKLLALAASALMACPSCVTVPMSAPGDARTSPPGGERKATIPSQSSSRPAKERYPDPRYRPAMNFAELQAVAGKVAKTTGRQTHWRLALGKDPGPLAILRGDLDDCTILIHPVAARKLPPNTWAFIFGHEFAHRVENLGTHSQSNPSDELKADIAGARYAMAAGYRLDAFLGWVLTEKDVHTKSHGSLHDRVHAVAARFGVSGKVIQAQARRYAAYRATH